MSKQPARKRPFGVTVIVILQIFSILVLVTDIFILEQISNFIGDQTDQLISLIRQWSGDTNMSQAVVGSGVILFVLVTTFGLWRLQRWAWFLVMIQLGIGMGFSLWWYFNGNRLYISMLINVLMVFYLNQRDVQQAFEYRPKSQEKVWTT